jgi:tetratricopeptide (TPR) repeat protein
LALAQVLLDNRSATAALEVLNQAPPPQDGALGTLILKSAALLGKGEAAEAEKLVDQMMKGRPDLGPVQTQYGLMMREKKDYAKAQTAFEKAIAADPYDSVAIQALASIYLSRNQAAAGEKAFEKMVANKPEYGPYVYGLVDMRLALKKDDQGIKDLDAYLARQPKDGLALRVMGDMKARVHDLKGSENSYRQALAMTPDSPELMIALGANMEAQKRPQEAQTLYREALKRRGDDPVAANNLAWLLSEGGGNIDEALKWSQLAKEKVPDNPSITDTLGWIYIKKNNPTLAISEFRDALRTAPKNPLYLYHMGVAQLKAGDPKQAEQNLQAALALKTDFNGIDDARKTLQQLQGAKR